MAVSETIGRQSLSGEWNITLDPENKGRDERWWTGNPGVEVRQASVPSTFQHTFPGAHGVVWYWRSFTPQRPPAAGEHALLHFHAVDYVGDVWLNGQHLGSHEGSETPFNLDATKALTPGENLLAVRVLNPTKTSIDGYLLDETPHRNKMMIEEFHPGNGMNFGGIVQHVELRLVPAVRITDLFARPDVDTGRIPVTITVRNDTKEPISVSVQVSAGPANEETALAAAVLTIEAAPGETVAEATIAVPEHRLWSLEDPYLYRVAARAEACGADGTVYQHGYAVRCGFRDFRVVNGFFRLNGKRLFLRATHTGNHFPVSGTIAYDPDLMRKDFVFAKASGFNMARFISGMPLAEQLDFCDEIGLLVYEENLSAWKLNDSDKMPERFDRSLREMILRDRQHPSVTIWGLLNETPDNPTFRHAVSVLPLLRELDPTRTVLLSSGRWDSDLTIGSVSNPGSDVWEPVWGREDKDAVCTPFVGKGAPRDLGQPAYVDGGGDVHAYPAVPQDDETNTFLRTIGAGTKPVFLSEYGIGSLLDVDHIVRRFQQSHMPLAADELRVYQRMLDRLEDDWERFGLAEVYPFPRDLLRESQRLHARHRLFGLNLIRSNPQLAGYNLTGMLDHGYTGEGAWTLWREWKPGVVDALEDGFSPLRWCLFVNPEHIYAGRTATVEAVLANEDVLAPGNYPARLRIFGPAGLAWEQSVTVRIEAPAAGAETPLAIPVFKGEVAIDGPAGSYVLAAQLDRGGSPAGDRVSFHVSDPAALPEVQAAVRLWGVENRMETWLSTHGVQCQTWDPATTANREVILVGEPEVSAKTTANWNALAAQIAAGSLVVFLSPAAFRRDDDLVGWLPLTVKGRCAPFSNWLYHREDIARPHPIFAGLPPRGIMEWDYYGQVIPRSVFQDQETPDDCAVVFITTGYASMNERVKSGYASGLVTASYPFGAGRFAINTLRILENIDRHPAADRLLLNIVAYAAGLADGPAAMLPSDFEEQLAAIGYS